MGRNILHRWRPGFRSHEHADDDNHELDCDGEPVLRCEILGQAAYNLRVVEMAIGKRIARETSPAAT